MTHISTIFSVRAQVDDHSDPQTETSTAAYFFEHHSTGFLLTKYRTQVNNFPENNAVTQISIMVDDGDCTLS